jgi:hypothetical protein
MDPSILAKTSYELSARRMKGKLDDREDYRRIMFETSRLIKPYLEIDDIDESLISCRKTYLH